MCAGRDVKWDAPILFVCATVFLFFCFDFVFFVLLVCFFFSFFICLFFVVVLFSLVLCLFLKGRGSRKWPTVCHADG